MRRTLIVMGRELRAFFYSPMSYLIAFLFVLMRGFETASVIDLFIQQGMDMETFPVFQAGTTAAVMMAVLVPPILTMRLFSEEKRTGSMELLMTTPVSDLEVTLGKWLAALVFYMVLWLPSFILLLLLQTPWLLDFSLPLGSILTVHLWVLLAGGLFLAVGLFASSLTQNQLASSLIGIAVNATLFFGPYLLVMTHKAPREGLLADLFAQVSLLDHMKFSFGRGLLDSSQIGFYLTATAAVLFFTVRSVEARKWV